MGYALFFVILAAIGAIAFVGILESGWMSSTEAAVNETKTTIYQLNDGQGLLEIGTPTVETGRKSVGDNDTSSELPNNTTNTRQLDISELRPSQQPSTQQLPSQQPWSEGPPPHPQLRSGQLPLETVPSYNCVTLDTLTTEIGNIKSPDYEQPYPDVDNCTMWLIDVGLGYSIDIILKVVDLNGPDDFLLIGSDQAQMMAESNPMIIGKLTSERRLRIFNSGTAFILFKTFEPGPNDTDSAYTGFFLSYERYGNLSESTEQPPTTDPSTLPDFQNDIKVFLAGKAQEEVYKIMRSFQDVVANMSAEYCLNNDISLNEAATYKNVLISLIGPCLITWPNSETCTQVNMSVALNTTSGNYSLTRPQLQDMWDSKAHNDNGLSNLGLQVYEVPNETTVLIWVGVSIAVIVLFILLLVITWRMEIFRDYNRIIAKPNMAKESQISTDSFIEVPPNFPGDFGPYNDALLQYSNIPPIDHTSDFEENKNSIPLASYGKQENYYSPTPTYGPPVGFSAALHFYGQNKIGFENLSFVEEEEEYESKSRAGTYDINDLEISNTRENKQENSHSLRTDHLYEEPKNLVKPESQK